MSKHKRQTRSLSPKVLPERAILKTDEYIQKSIAKTYEDINIENTSATNTYSGTLGIGNIDRVLTGYMLMLSRYSIPVWRKKGYETSHLNNATSAISHMITNKVYRDCFEIDPTNGTSNTKPISSLLNVDIKILAQYPNDVLLEALLTSAKYCGTEAFTTLKRACTNPIIKKTLGEIHSLVYDEMPWNVVLQLNITHPKEYQEYKRFRAKKRVKELALKLLHIARNAVDDVQTIATLAKPRLGKVRPMAPPNAGTKPAKDLHYGNVVNGEGWEPLRVEKCALELNHTGRLGRKKYNTDSGTRVRHIDRIVTDPEQRIFSATAKSLGGVVVIDCSGSMHLEESDVERLVNASAGATIVLYRHKRTATGETKTPNLYIFAKGNRRARQLPSLGGYNGVDAPALEYAAKLRQRASQPIIWVSDGAYNGQDQSGGEKLDNDMHNVTRKYNIIRLSTVDDAIEYLRRKQGAIR